MKILITGAGRRIGRALSLYLAAKGHQIIIHYNSSQKNAQEIFKLIGGSEKGHQLIQADLLNKQQANTLISKLAPFDILINNASIYNRISLENISFQEIYDDYQINFFTPFILMQQFKKLCQNGQVINFLDQRIDKVDPKAGIYALAKKSLRDITEACAVEWAPNIRVNAIAPGQILPVEGVSKEDWQAECDKLPMQKAVDLEEISQACIFLIENNLTGQILYLDNGDHLL